MRRIRRTRGVVAALLLVAVLWGVDSVGRALTAAGSDSVAARLAEWSRFHHLGFIVTGLEKLQYDLNPPRTGGAPKGGIPSARRVGGAPTATSPQHAAAGLPAPAPVAVQAGTPLPNEGQWQTLESVRGLPAIRETFVRPDAQHTSYLAGIAWMDPTLVRFELHPGTEVPGGSGWTQPPAITSSHYAGLLATFNSGFTMTDARGGFWENGRQVGTLRPGAASLVINAAGQMNVEAWGASPTPPPGVVAVRQNLALLVSGGQLAPGLDTNAGNAWGATLGNKDFVWRSALGVTRTGALVYVAGAALSAHSLAQLEVAAGAVRAMELDINPEWTTFMSYSPGPAGTVVPTKLTADEQNSARRYLRVSSRDFLAAYAR